ncbi:imm11 family protein [Reinekea marinisedimentorum]|uniref:Immunity MXAN-0049 protein domain-containing protein n=1 Tax=Reinekea marinisedimentorum TaxID=230495 RepID=A0A4R3HQD1_9GAMM|nr:DUF1629 domain-containing protein [Reinekea marinisedimentorum]TCS34398.1 hypothetical protein BCF53_1432 [Reinekea marinisedimentorum]
MAIYELSWNQKYAECGGISRADKRALRWFHPALGDPLPPLNDWQVPTVAQYLEGLHKTPTPYGDLVSNGGNVLLSGRAVGLLKSFLDGITILYPVIVEEVPDEEYFLLSLRNELPFEALDRYQSTGSPVRHGVRANQGFLAPIHNWVFNEEFVSGQHLFSLPDRETTYYVSERFKDAVVEAGLTGFCFKNEFYDENLILT